MKQNTITKSSNQNRIERRRTARRKALLFLSGFASQERDPEVAAELERIAAFVREREASDEIDNTTEG